MNQNDTPDNKLLKSHQFQVGNKLSKGRPLGSKNKKSQVTEEKALRDLQSLYLKAVRKGELSLALRVKVSQARIAEVFRTRKLPEIPKLSDMNQDQHRELLEIMMAGDPTIRDHKTPLEEYHYPVSGG